MGEVENAILTISCDDERISINYEQLIRRVRKTKLSKIITEKNSEKCTLNALFTNHIQIKANFNFDFLAKILVSLQCKTRVIVLEVIYKHRQAG